MLKYIFITNGTGGCGKDTFASFLHEFIPVKKCSSIDKVKSIAKQCGWNGEKTERDRKFLSDLKLLTSAYSNMPFNDIQEQVMDFYRSSYYSILLIDIREPEEIEKAKKEFGARTILIKNDRVSPITSNMADANVNNYTYDFVIENNGTLDDFRETVRLFAMNILEKENSVE